MTEKKRYGMSPEAREQHEQVQRMLLERIEVHEKRAADRRAQQQKPEKP